VITQLQCALSTKTNATDGNILDDRMETTFYKVTNDLVFRRDFETSSRKEVIPYFL
jgi:hypothetical protein